MKGNNESARQHFSEFVRQHIYGMLSSISMAILASYIARSIDNASSYIAFLATLIPGYVIGHVLDTIKKSKNELASCVEELKTSTNQLHSEINSEMPLIIKKLQILHDRDIPIQALLDARPDQLKIIKYLIHKSMEDYFNVPKAKSHQFYECLIDCLGMSRRWEGIHQGSLSLLGDDPPDKHLGFRYFEVLSAASKREGSSFRRVIIQPQEAMKKDLDDNKIMYEFWKHTGQHVNSYWVTSEKIKDLLNGIPECTFDDCALYEGGIVLQYNRSHEIITFSANDNNDAFTQATIKIFTELDNPERLVEFTLITEEDIKDKDLGTEDIITICERVKRIENRGNIFKECRTDSETNIGLFEKTPSRGAPKELELKLDTALIPEKSKQIWAGDMIVGEPAKIIKIRAFRRL